MGNGRVLLSRPRGANCVVAAGLALSLLIAAPKSVPAAQSAEPSRAEIREFRAICDEITEARELLASGRMDDAAFADTLLALFLRADNLADQLTLGPSGNPARLTLQRGAVYLIESLRANWMGVAAKNGMDFADADLALKAAVAWRSNVPETVSP